MTDDRFPVSFGPREDDQLSIHLASDMLTRWRLKNPKQWGDQLREILLERAQADAAAAARPDRPDLSIAQ